MIRMIDAMRTGAGNIPRGTLKVGGYVTGSGDVPWTDKEWGMFPKAGHVAINQEPGSGKPFVGNVKDIEDRAGSIADFVAEAKIRWEQRHWNYCAYISASQVAELIKACQGAGLVAVELFVADWALNEQQATAQLGFHDGNPYEVVAVQWASPSSNPQTIVPGGTMTLREANLDLSVTKDAWFAYQAPAPPAPPPPPAALSATLRGSVLGQNLTVPIKSIDGGKNWTA